MQFRAENLIELEDLDPKLYLLWVDKAKASFLVAKVLPIVDGRQSNPFPLAESANLTVAQRKELDEWQHKDDLARSALISSLKPTEHLKVFNLTTAHAVWSRLQDEYGQISDLKRATAETKWHSLVKTPSTSMSDHVDKLISLQQELNFQHPGDIPSSRGQPSISTSSAPSETNTDCSIKLLDHELRPFKLQSCSPKSKP